MNQNPNEIARDVVTEKSVVHDGVTDVWDYDISTDSNFILGGSVTGPDGSTSSESYYPTDIAFRGYGGANGFGGLPYATKAGWVLKEKKWIHLGGVVPAFGSLSQANGVNSVVEAEFTTLIDEADNRIKTSAVKYEYDYNGEVLKTTEYDWYTPQTDPFVIPTNAPVLRGTESDYHNEATNSSSSNAYQNRTLGTSGIILGRPKEVFVGDGTNGEGHDAVQLRWAIVRYGAHIGKSDEDERLQLGQHFLDRRDDDVHHARERRDGDGRKRERYPDDVRVDWRLHGPLSDSDRSRAWNCGSTDEHDRVRFLHWAADEFD